MGSETNFFVAIPYNGRTELTSYTHDRMIRRLRTGELSTHTHRERRTAAIESQKAESLQRQKSQHMDQQGQSRARDQRVGRVSPDGVLLHSPHVEAVCKGSMRAILFGRSD